MKKKQANDTVSTEGRLKKQAPDTVSTGINEKKYASDTVSTSKNEKKYASDTVSSTNSEKIFSINIKNLTSMATETNFRQINPFLRRMQAQSHTRYLNWVQRFQQRVYVYVIQELESDCPAKITAAYNENDAAVTALDTAFRTIQKSAYTQQILDADTARDNTWLGLKGMVESLGRIGTSEQQAAAARWLDTASHYNISVSQRYEDENTNILQFIQ